MKLLRTLTFALGIAAFLMSFSIPAYAKGGQCQHSEEHVKTMREAATALQTLNPGLAADLNKYADEEEKVMKKFRGKCEAAAKDMRASAKALENSNPDLATQLNNIADRKDKMVRGEEVDWEKDFDADLKTLKDSSAVLQPMNADLSEKLSKIVAQKEAMKEWTKEGEDEKTKAATQTSY